MKRALVVDDDEAIRDYIREILETEDFIVFEAKDGESALKILKTFPQIELLITDILMPGIEGVGLLISAQREKRRAGQSLKTIAISGGGRCASGQFYLDIANDFGADATLSKPFSDRKFRQVLAKIGMIDAAEYETA